MIKCRTKKLAIEGTKKINDAGIHCEFDGFYNIYAFKTGETEAKGYAVLTERRIYEQSRL